MGHPLADPDNPRTLGFHDLVTSQPHTALTCASRCDRDPTNRSRPCTTSCTDPLHPCLCPDSRRSPTPHERTPHAGTVRVRTLLWAHIAGPGNTVFCIWQPCARDSGNKIAASAHGVGSGGLAVDAMAIGCLGMELVTWSDVVNRVFRVDRIACACAGFFVFSPREKTKID